ncbi:hypothetical protein GCM10023322_71990 [Rugosimonospora acidiphila]|uniref:P/Homo B domain-containing protein n=1 Tax=Rugosimonospora acidiphila TaxID=556531 RepID=A0ABP9SL62_9ACTN
MRLALVLPRFLAATVLAMGISAGLATPAHASTTDGGTLTPGTPVTAQITAPDQHIEYKFTGVAGRHVTFDVTASAWADGTAPSTAYFHLYNPAGGYSGYVYLGQGPNYGDFTLPTSGTWRLVLDPTGSATGHVTFGLYTDVADRGLSPSVPVNTTISHRGQNAGYYLTGTTGQHVIFEVTSSAWSNGSTPGNAYFHLYNPAGVYSGYIYLAQSATYADFTLTASGTWRLVLDPTGPATGHITFGLYTDVPDRGLSPNVPVNTTISHPGQNAGYYFTGTTGQHVTFDITSSTWSSGTTPGVAYFHLYSPAGVYSGYIYLAQSPTYADFTLTASGTWRLTLDPTGAATGHVTVTLLKP